MSEPTRITIATIADMQLRFNENADGFDLTVVGTDPSGRDVEVTLPDQMAIGLVNGVVHAMEQNAARNAAIKSGRGRLIDEPEIRTFPQTPSAH